MPKRRLLRDIGCQARLAHGRAGRHYDQVARLEAAGEVVQVREAGRGAGQAYVALGELLELVDLPVEELLQGAHLAAAVLVPDPEQPGLEALDQLPGVAAMGQDFVLDLP